MSLPIPDKILSQHIGVVGKTGSGKTSTSKLLIETAVANGARVCVLDPIKSDWWGLTSSADGKREGLPFHILGGPRGHVPLHAQAGGAIGEIVGNGSLPLSILDMADFEMGGLQTFFTHFAPALLRKMRGVLYLVVEEAHEFAPKERGGFGAENMAIHFAKKIATAGRSKGIRLIVATQRTQSLHNAVLGSCETIMAHRLTAPADQEPVVKWLKANLPPEKAKEVSASLQSLKTGEAWVCSGELGYFERVQFPRISTYDNSATPTNDLSAVSVKTATVDHEKLRTIIGAAVEQAKENDPAHLKGEITRLRAELDKTPEPAEPQEVKVPDAEALREHRLRLNDVTSLVTASQETLKAQSEALGHIRANLEQSAAVIIKQLEDATALKFLPRPVLPPNEEWATWKPGAAPQPACKVSYAEKISGMGESLPRAEKLILNCLAQFGSCSKNRIAAVTGYAVNGGGFNNALSALRTKLYITDGDPMEIRAQGSGALGKFEPLPIGQALIAHWERQLSKAEAAIFRVVCDAYPHPLEKATVAKLSGYEVGGGGFNNALSRLRTLELINRGQQIKASANLFVT